MKIFKKEKDVAKLAMNYLKAVESCVEPAKEAVIAHINADSSTVASLHPKVVALESEADEMRRAIEDKLFSGAYLPLMRGDICSVIEALDRVPNAAESCCALFAGEKPDIPADFKEPFLQITADSFAIVEDLGSAVRDFFKTKGKIDAIREHVKAVGVRESEVDRQEWRLTVAIFASDLELAQKMHLRRALDRIVNIPDRAENAAETLAQVAMKSVL